jgi:osmoprotectant transport system substrate-binding protein
MKHRTLFALLCIFACMLSISACGDDNDDDGGGSGSADTGTQTTEAASAGIQKNTKNGTTKIVVGSKNFTEQKVLGEIYAQGLAAAGYAVDTELNLGDEKVAQTSLKGGQIDGYPEYTGTALLSLCNVPTDDIPKDPAQAFEDTKTCFAKDKLTAFPPTPFTSSNEVGVKEATAKEFGLSKISDLSKVDQDFTLYGSPECRQRTDCLLGLEQTYGLKFKKFTPVDIDLRHSVLDKGKQVASIVFTTDPQNKREGITLLDDDKGMFPPYNSTFVVRDEIAEKAGPDLPKVLAQIQEGLTDEVMQELNARVDLDKETPQQVAQAYLQESGLVAS